MLSNIPYKKCILIVLIACPVGSHSSENKQSHQDTITPTQVLFRIGGLTAIGVTTYFAMPFLVSGGAIVATKTAAAYTTTKVAAVAAASKVAGAVTVAAPYVTTTAKCTVAVKCSWWGGGKIKTWLYPSQEQQFNDMRNNVTDERKAIQKGFTECLLTGPGREFSHQCKATAHEYALLFGEADYKKQLKMARYEA